MTAESIAEAPKDEKPMAKKQPGFPKRYVITLMLFLGLATQYALRVNINIAITAMCNNITVKRNGFTITKVSPKWNVPLWIVKLRKE